jgi:hypothetical protein
MPEGHSSRRNAQRRVDVRRHDAARPCHPLGCGRSKLLQKYRAGRGQLELPATGRDQRTTEQILQTPEAIAKRSLRDSEKSGEVLLSPLPLWKLRDRAEGRQERQDICGAAPLIGSMFLRIIVP